MHLFAKSAVQPLHRLAYLRQMGWEETIAFLTVGASAAFTFQSLHLFSLRFWMALLIFILFTLGLLSWWNPQLARGQKQQIVCGMVGLGCLLFAVSENTYSASILFFILSAGVMEFFSARRAYAWIVAFGLITMLAGLWKWGDFWLAISLGLASLGGYFFFGSSTSARMRADQASAESQRLLQELQAAHSQLQMQAAQAEELAASEERNRLARELHDTLGHRLTVAAVQLEGAQKLIAQNPDKAAQMVGEVRTQVVEGLTELRGVVAALRTPLAQDISLPGALTRLLNDFADATGIRTHLDVAAQLPDLPAQYRHTLYRAAQESLTNIQRHAQAGSVHIALVGQGDLIFGDGLVDANVQMSISDDGIGMPEQALPQGYGLRGIQERASQLGGTCIVEPHQPQGTRIHIVLPLPLADGLQTDDEDAPGTNHD